MERISHILILTVSYLFLLAYNGYIYGHGDMIELLPSARWMADSSLYPNDFYLQNTISNFPDKRYVLVKLFHLLNGGAWLAFILHFFCSIFLIEGLYSIAKKYISAEILIWPAILIPISILYGKNLGGNEMYIPLFISSTMAKAIGIWAVYYFLSKENRWKTIYFLLIIAAFIQPLVSAQLFCLITGVYVIERLFFSTANSPQTKHILLGVIAYACTAGVWLYFMNRSFSNTAIDTQLLFDSYEFRASHHYLPSYFPIKYYVLLLPTFLFGMIYFFKNERRLFYFFGLAMLGMLFYWIGVEQLQLSSILASQWFKSTVWLKALSFIAIFGLIDRSFPIFRTSDLFQKGLNVGMGIVGLLSVITLFGISPISFPNNRTYEVPFIQSINPQIAISLKAGQATPKDATFLVPFSNSHFKYYSERSSYVEFKGFVHQQAAIPEWYDRMKAVYGLDISNKRNGDNLQEQADIFYKNLSVESLQDLSNKGVTHVLTFKEVKLPFKEIASTDLYVVYEL